jgi:hypothetical protein
MVITGHNPWRFLWILTLIWDITAHDSVKNDLVNYGTEKGAQTMVLERMGGVPSEGILAQLACLGSGVHCVCGCLLETCHKHISVSFEDIKYPQ